MTFYNHIESVRHIAIDLTNGRKWRGASDKAAVFDALDAARREYMRLSEENAKLRELVVSYDSALHRMCSQMQGHVRCRDCILGKDYDNEDSCAIDELREAAYAVKVELE